MLDLFELLRGADNTQRLWELVQQPGAIEVLMHSANTPQVLLCYIDTTLLSYYIITLNIQYIWVLYQYC